MTKEKVEEIRARYNAIESMDPAATIDYIEFAKQAHRDRLDLLRYIDSLHAEPGDNARLNAAIESAHLTKTQRRLFEESWNGTAENRPAEPT
jgi:hypothetical protein